MFEKWMIKKLRRAGYETKKVRAADKPLQRIVVGSVGGAFIGAMLSPERMAILSKTPEIWSLVATGFTRAVEASEPSQCTGCSGHSPPAPPPPASAPEPPPPAPEPPPPAPEPDEDPVD